MSKRGRSELTSVSSQSVPLVVASELVAALTPKALAVVEQGFQRLVRRLVKRLTNENLFIMIDNQEIKVPTESFFSEERAAKKAKSVTDGSRNKKIRDAVLHAYKDMYYEDLPVRSMPVENDIESGPIRCESVFKYMSGTCLQEENQQYEIVALYITCVCQYVAGKMIENIKGDPVSSKDVNGLFKGMDLTITSIVHKTNEELMDFNEDMVEQVNYSEVSESGFRIPSVILPVWFNYAGLAGKRFSDALHTPKCETALSRLYSKYPESVYVRTENNGTELFVNIIPVEMKDKQLLVELTEYLKDKNSEPEANLDLVKRLKEQYDQKLNASHENMKQQSMLLHCSENNYWSNLSNKNFLTNQQMLLEVLSFLELPSLLNACAVCKEWFRMICCPPGASHNPLIKEIDYTELKDTCKLERSSSLIPILSRFGHNLTLLNLSWSIYIKPEHLMLVGVFCSKLRSLNLEHVPLTDQIIVSIAKTNPDLRELFLENCFENDPSPFFQHCKNLEHIKVASDESDIAIENVTDATLLMLANNNNGCITTLEFEMLTAKVTDAGMANLVNHCPKLKQFTYTYEMYELESMDSPPAKSKTVEALQKIALERLSLIRMNFISPGDKKIARKIARRTHFDDEDEDDDE